MKKKINKFSVVFIVYSLIVIFFIPSCIKDDLNKNIYLCTAMDGETFGHHRPELEKALFKILSSSRPKQIFLSELPKYFKAENKIKPIEATWASSRDDIEKGVQFFSWRSPKNNR